jgi:hypothetical protein
MGECCPINTVFGVAGTGDVGVGLSAASTQLAAMSVSKIWFFISFFRPLLAALVRCGEFRQLVHAFHLAVLFDQLVSERSL